MKLLLSLFVVAALVVPLVRPQTGKTCEITQYWDGSACKACPANCGSCRWNPETSQVWCTSCKDVNFWFDFQNGTNCESCAEHCNACTGPKDWHCSQPANGWLFSPHSNKLVECNVAGCLWCDDANNCSRCGAGWRADGNGGCQKCSASQCTNCDEDAATCTRCAAEWTLVNNKCSRCGDNCLQCDSSLQCSKCFKGFLLENGQCTTCPVHCVSCSNSQSCSTCFKGYWWDDSKKECASCPPLCRSCSDANTCTDCFDGWSLNDGKCVECSEGCASCDANGNCNKCNLGFALNDNTHQCEECSDPCCVDCGPKDVCKKCSHTSVLIDGACHSVDTCEWGSGLKEDGSCDVCSNKWCQHCDHVNNKCKVCVFGFYPDGNDCKPCPKGTLDCWRDDSGAWTLIKNTEHVGGADDTGLDICLNSLVQANETNSVGYFCPDGCASCSNKGVCRKCMPGFILAQSLNNWNVECRNLSEVEWVVSNYTVCWVDDQISEPVLVLRENQGSGSNETEPPTISPASATYLTTTGFLIALILSALL